MKRYFSFLFCTLWSICLIAQNKDENYTYRIKKTTEKINLDGVLTESVWKNTQKATDFFLNKPFDTAYAKAQTIVSVTFDEQNLYIAATCYQDKRTYRVSSLKRDFEGGSSDVFTVNIDTYKDKLNAFHFALSPFNVQREGLIDNGENLVTFWDNKWYSAVKNYDYKWVIEMAIPFKTLRYKVTEGHNDWRINFARNVLENNEISTWSPVPRNFTPNNTAFNGLLSWEDAPPRPSKNITIIPFVSANAATDFPRTEELQKLPTINTNSQSIGADAKIAVTSALNLDLTFNPDFSQVEVDRQVANLSRFELFFPERRQFFLENSDLFDKWGFPNSRPFFSRRIGIGENPVTGENARVPIIAGARLSGKIDNKTRIGVINMQTKSVDFGNDQVLPATNYSVATMQRTVFNRSILGAVAVNKQNFLKPLTNAQKANFNAFNRVVGLEYNHYSADGKWEGESYYHHSFSPDKNGHSLAQYVGFSVPTFSARLGYMQVGKGYETETGFTPRDQFRSFYTSSDYAYFTPDKWGKKLNTIGLSYEGDYVLDWDGKLLDVDAKVGTFVELDDQSNAYVGVNLGYTYLFFPFDPTNAFLSADPDLKKNIVDLPIGHYTYPRFAIGCETSKRNWWSFEFDYNRGKYFNGKSTVFEGSVGARIQPYGNISIDYNYYNIKLPAPYNTTRYWLVGPRADFAFSRKLFTSALLQYNTQTNNMNINARLQWRFRPVSDMFLVYTQNYFAENIPNYNVRAFDVKNRAIVFKITYWLNL
jgi:Domain of unknown function (DUF5916)/Carbohydrate family 9 binding domain-like